MLCLHAYQTMVMTFLSKEFASECPLENNFLLFPTLFQAMLKLLAWLNGLGQPTILGPRAIDSLSTDFDDRLKTSKPDGPPFSRNVKNVAFFDKSLAPENFAKNNYQNFYFSL